MKLTSKYWLRNWLISPPWSDAQMLPSWERAPKRGRPSTNPVFGSWSARGQELLRRLLAREPLLEYLVVRPVRDQVLQRAVDGVLKRGVLLLHRKAVALARLDRLDDVEFGILLKREGRDGEVVDDSVDLAGLERVERGPDPGICLHRRVGLVLCVILTRGALLDPDRSVAGDIGGGCEVAPLLDHQRLVGLEVRIRERDLLLAGRGNRRRGGDDVELAGLLVGEDRAERGVDPLRLQVELLGYRIHEVDVESRVVGRLALLERRIRDVRSDRERAIRDQPELSAATSTAGRARAIAAAATPRGDAGHDRCR